MSTLTHKEDSYRGHLFCNIHTEKSARVQVLGNRIADCLCCPFAVQVPGQMCSLHSVKQTALDRRHTNYSLSGESCLRYLLFVGGRVPVCCGFELVLLEGACFCVLKEQPRENAGDCSCVGYHVSTRETQKNRSGAGRLHGLRFRRSFRRRLWGLIESILRSSWFLVVFFFPHHLFVCLFVGKTICSFVVWGRNHLFIIIIIILGGNHFCRVLVPLGSSNLYSGLLSHTIIFCFFWGKPFLSSLGSSWLLESIFRSSFPHHLFIFLGENHFCLVLVPVGSSNLYSDLLFHTICISLEGGIPHFCPAPPPPNLPSPGNGEGI